MPLNLADESVDYSNNAELFPVEKAEDPSIQPYGSFECTLLDYFESGPPGTEKNKGAKEYDLVTLRIDTSTCPMIKPGEVYGFFFQTGGDGMSVKQRPYKIKESRAFIAAAHGVELKSIAIKDFPAKRQELIDNVYEGTDKIRLTTKKGNKRDDGTHYRNDIWSPA